MPRNDSLTLADIVATARVLVDEDGLDRLSMRRLGARLGVDPMAVYRHVTDKQELLAHLVSSVLAEVPSVGPPAPWADRIEAWAVAYWRIAAANRDLVAAALADPRIARGALPATQPLIEAVAASGLSADRVEANAFLVVDFVHGSALGTGDARRPGGDSTAALEGWFRQGLTTIIAGIARLAEPDPLEAPAFSP